jgi:hypothetical protein
MDDQSLRRYLRSESNRSEICGKWILYSNENLDEYLNELGVCGVMRQAAANITPSLWISNSEDNWNIIFKTDHLSSEKTFKEGQEYDESKFNF